IRRRGASCRRSGPGFGQPPPYAAKATLPAWRPARSATRPESPSMVQGAPSAVLSLSGALVSLGRLPQDQVSPSLNPAYLAAGKSDSRKALSSCHGQGPTADFLSSKAIPVILEIQGRFSVICALVAFPAHPTREESCTLRARNRYKP